MAAGYELFLRTPAGAALEAEALARALGDLGRGVRAEPFVGEGGDPARPRGVDLALEEGTPIARLLDAAFPLAKALGLEVFDPQSGATVTEAQRERIEASYAELCAYRADTLGEVGAMAVMPPPTPTQGSRTRLHLWLIVAGIIVAFLLLARGCRWLV